MTLDLSQPLRTGSRAWCSNCSWEHFGPWCHKHATDHHRLLGHMVHLYEPEPGEAPEACGDIAIVGGSTVYDCVRAGSHPAPHADAAGHTWTRSALGILTVDNPVDSGDNS